MKFAKLTHEEKDQLKSYVNSIKEIKKEINALLEKAGTKLKEEEGGNKSSGLIMNLDSE
jgi:hypothetical protein